MNFGNFNSYKPNPRENANIFSVATLSFTLPTFFQGFKKDLEISDLYETYSKHQSKTLGDKIEQEWKNETERAHKSKTQPSFKRVLLATLGLQFMWLGLICFLIECVVKMSLPLLLGQLISFYAPHQNTITQAQSYGYAGSIIACSFLLVLLQSPFVLEMCHVGMKMRVACCSLIYRKALRLSNAALGHTTIGQMVNLLSNDVNRIESAIAYIHQSWCVPVQTILGMYIMYQEMGVSAVIGVVVLILFVLLQLGLANRIAKLRSKSAQKTDERIRLMNEIILGTQVIKMYAWEKPFAKFMSLARKNEVKFVREAMYLRGITYSFSLILTHMSLFVSVTSYVIFGYQITAKKVFVLAAFCYILQHSMTLVFPRSLTFLMEGNVSINRLIKFMLLDERSSTHTPSRKVTNINGHYRQYSFIQRETSKNSISIVNGLAKWCASSSDSTFQDLNIQIKRGSLVAIVGPVGSGKSSLMQVLLQELPLLQGKLEVHGRISYAAQEPWVFTGTIRQNIIFHKPYEEFRYKKVLNMCALISDLNTFPNSDQTVVGERGITLSGGQRARINLARAIYQDADIYLLDDPLSAVDSHVGRRLFSKCIKGYLSGKTVILVTHQLQYLKDVDHIVTLETGLIKTQGTFEELQNLGLDFTKLLKNELNDEEVQEPTRKNSRNVAVPTAALFDGNNEDAQHQNKEQHAKGIVSKATYMGYIAASGCGLIFVILLLFLLAQTAVSIGDIFISRWINAEEARSSNSSDHATEILWNVTTHTSAYIYMGIILVIIILVLLRSFLFFYVCMKSSVKLHDNMFNSVINATMRFFHTNSVGIILNRFSKDVGGIDELLPIVTADCVQAILKVFGSIVVIATVNPLLLVPTVVLMHIFYFLRVVYLRTSRNVKRLEGVTRSPVFSHLSASVQGLTTIRAFGADSTLIGEFDHLQDLHSVPWFLFISTARAFGYWLDMLCVVFIAIVTISSVVSGDTNSSSNVGLAITQALGLIEILQWGMRQTAEMENLMTSVERVLEYSSIEQEKVLEIRPNNKPSASWPQNGEIRFENVSLHYFPTDPPTLKNVSFAIKPLEKVGIVGRTGAGKSSLINALFQLTDTLGSILIDDVDVKEIALHDLRSKISIIPQEPILFSGTLKKNLDPFQEYSDVALWKSLDAVELKNAIKEMNLGLDATVLERGCNFSVGQRQLICLARAMLRNNRILVLDEATASVDPQTDALIQATIRKEFANCTVLTIAHRLNTVMDSDKILVMDAGTLVEFDHPFLLIQNPDGVLYSMVQQTGSSMAITLTNIAKENFEKFEGSNQNSYQ